MNSVKIGPITYDVKIVERLLNGGSGKLDGQISYSRQLIELDSALCSDAQRQTLWHEIIHGILTQSGRHDGVSDDVIDALAYGVFGVIKDNPEIADAELA